MGFFDGIYAWSYLARHFSLIIVRRIAHPRQTGCAFMIVWKEKTMMRVEAISLWLGNSLREGIHFLAEVAGEGCGGREAERDDEEAPPGAEVEVVGGRLVAVGEGLVDDEDDA